MNIKDFLGRGLAFPVAFENGKMALSSEERLIEESILIILSTSKGERLRRPEFGAGLNELVFSKNNSGTAARVEFNVREALNEWEPRIEVLEVNVEGDKNEPGRLNIRNRV